ncbi:hypothetical protein HG536_0A02820 [Torulaspora globosa]|uniref:Uncharacterized protein n=1 Tax=Torulaspora globosa TaxID=48254 RepID=A0A7G3ZAC9_9SACH|nr:uncharacterized protein HG536_0A02820 [Torulaspora globosa]QLL30465.1 hypothetical protein HG536_0A02820 [Torulaspora globosa]
MNEEPSVTEGQAGWRLWWNSRGIKTQQQDCPNQDAHDTTNTEVASSNAAGVTETALNNTQDVKNESHNADQTADNKSWYANLMSKVSSIGLGNHEDAFIIEAGIHYSQLNEVQLRRVKEDSLQKVARRANSWCWFEDLTAINDNSKSWLQRSGLISVQGTSSEHCPFPLEHYPAITATGYEVYLQDSLIMPSRSPLDILHTQSLKSKVAAAVKSYYNFPSEKHLYLKENTDGLLRSKNVLIISVVGSLPDKYEKFSLGEQRSAYYLARKLAQSVDHEVPSAISSLSFECPLDSKELDTVLKETIALLDNWKDIFKDVSSIFFIGVYHSVPLVISLAQYILKNHDVLGFAASIPVGLLAIESILQGYRFWDHSTDAINSDERSYQKIQQAREKQLFQGVGKEEKEILLKHRHYRKLDSEESKLVQKNLDWLLYNWDSFRLNFCGKIYDNFMTASQKLAIDYVHPKILRNLWCDGRHLGCDLKHPDKWDIPDVDIKTPKFECTIRIPGNRAFEITLLNCLLLALNLGYTEFVPIMKLLSPFFISRSFNENTMSPSLKKQKLSEMKTWLQEIDAKSRPDTEGPHDELPKSVSTVHKFMEFALYHNSRSPEVLKVHSEIYDDDTVYSAFIENTIKTRSPLIKKHLRLLDDHSAPQSILNAVNQFDLVWKFHEFISDYAKLRNLPHQEHPEGLNFSISLGYSLWQQSYADPTMFQRNNQEAICRLKQIWESYQDWDPPTRGLKQLKNILSVLSLYNEFSHLLQDITGK